MTKVNPALFDPLNRIENAARRAAGIMLTGPNRPAKECDLVKQEIQEIGNALEAFKAAIEAGEMPGFQNGAIRSHEQN
jgi:hypothetical protein